jgi:hypothetical protein
MKYKVGDKVKIKEKLVPGERYGEYLFISTMKESLGKEATITEILRNESYCINLDGGDWYWTDEMLEDVVEKQVPLTNGDLVRVIKSTLSEEKKKYIGKEYEIKDIRTDRYSYRLDGIDFFWFSKEELELVEALEKEPIELITPNLWTGKQYKISYAEGSRYKDVFGTNDGVGCKVTSTTGKLINYHSPFTGRLFIENPNGALEIILMESIVHMKEIKEGK